MTDIVSGSYLDVPPTREVQSMFIFSRESTWTTNISSQLFTQLRRPWKTGISSVQSLSCVQLFATLWTAVCQDSLYITNFQSLFKLTIELVMPSNHLILYSLLLLLPSIFHSLRVFSSESVLCIRWPKYWSFSFSISLSNYYSGLISFRIDWFDLLSVQGTLKSLLQHHSSKASTLWHSAFFVIQLSHSYMITGKTIALTRWTFVSKVRSLLFNMLSRLVIAFLPRSKHLLISWLRPPSTVILECRTMKSAQHSKWLTSYLLFSKQYTKSSIHDVLYLPNNPLGWIISLLHMNKNQGSEMWFAPVLCS